jgi:hypothetical protein
MHENPPDTLKILPLNMRISVLVIGILLFLVQTQSGCEKCACCGPILGYTYYCTKDTTTLTFVPWIGGSFNDSLNYYRNMGFICDSTMVPAPNGTSSVCGSRKIASVEKSVGYTCDYPSYFDCGQ